MSTSSEIFRRLKGRDPAGRLGVFLLAAAGLLPGCNASSAPPPTAETAQATSTSGEQFMPKIQKTDAEWRSQLTDEQYHVTRQKGTERAFTGQYWNTKDKGKYKCVCCGAELFTSETKYDSGCGWPSFYAASQPENVHMEEDLSYGMIRTEVQCSQCGAHLGHIFDDGPQPTGQRYCMNSASLKFEKQDDGAAGKESTTEQK